MQITLCSTDILTILSFLIYEHGITFHISVSSLFISVFKHTSFTTLVKGYSKTFYSLCFYWRWHCFPNLIFRQFLSVQTSTNFHILILLPDTLPNLLLVLTVFLDPWNFLHIRKLFVCHLKTGNFTSVFLTWILAFLFPCLNPLAR